MSCKNAEDGNKVLLDGAIDNSNEITAKKIQQLKYTDYDLSAEAKKTVSTRQAYQEVTNQVTYLKKADLNYFKNDKAVLVGLAEDLKRKIPDQLNTKPILSRIVVIKTTLLKLHSNLILDNIPSDIKLQSIKEFLEAVSNLNLQINKKLEFDEFDNIQPE